MFFKKPKTCMESWSLPTNHGLRCGECPPRLPSAAAVSRAGPARRRTRRSGPACLPDNATLSRKIDEVNQSIDDVLAGTVPARVVFQF
jgi:hypothetical protein